MNKKLYQFIKDVSIFESENIYFFRHKIFIDMLEKDLEIIRKILKGHHFVDNYIDVLINYVMSHLETTSLGQITPHFLYSALAFELGRNTARDISEDFEDYKKTGEYKSKLQRFLDKSPYMK